MDTELSHTQELIDRPGESLSVELKRWIDPDQPEGIAKIAKAALALRNFDGGYLVIGFDNNTLEPDKENVPDDVTSAFHIDKIQGIVSRYTSEPFEISIELPERDGQQYPVIVIPSGVKTPVAAKSELRLTNGGKPLIQVNDVYIRSLQSNNTPSTTKATWKDWSKVVEICFDNREADIGRFLRRHLGGITPDIVKEFTSVLAREPETTTEELLLSYLQESKDRYGKIVEDRKITLPKHGSWEVALLIIGQVPEHSANRNFLNLLGSSNPDYTGWPVWLDSQGFIDENSRPFVYERIWESFIASLDSGWSNNVDFMRLDPKGKFYLYRALQEDISGSQRAPIPLTALDFGLPVIRTAEAIAVGIAFSKAMGCVPENTLLSFAFRWSGLSGRELSSWAQPGSYISPGRKAYQDDVIAYVNVPLDTPLSALGEYVNQVIQPLLEVFDGFFLGKEEVEDFTRRLIERRL